MQKNDDPDAFVSDPGMPTAQTNATDSAEQEKARRLERLRIARKQFDTVTVGGGRHPVQPQKPKEQQKRLVEMNTAPVYRFQIAEAFQHDVPSMKAPSGVSSSVKTAVGVDSSTRKVVPLVPQASLVPSATADATQEQVQVEAPNESALALTVQDKEKVLDPDEVLMMTIQKAASKRSLASYDMCVAPDDEIEISKLKTAEDVVSYFSLHGDKTSVKFVYLNYAPQTLSFRPYDLNVVLRGQQDSEHFVISSTGVVHIRPNQPSEVVTLSDWMRETAMFNVLRRIRFFRNYLFYKAFTQWRKNIRLKLYSDTRRKVCKKFFMSKSTFAATSVDLYKLAYDLTTTPLFHYEPNGKHDYVIEEFNRDQSKQRVKANQELGLTLEKMESKLTKLTEAIQQRANVPDLTTMESLEQYLLANSAATEREKRSGKKTKSMLDAKREQYERMRELKRSMVEYSMLDSYIRLIDYVAAENIFKNALLTVINFYDVINEQMDKEVKRVGFQILIQPSEEAMVFKPAEGEIIKTYTDVVEDIVQNVNGVIRLINQKPLKIFFAKTPKLWNIGTEFKRDARVINTKQLTYKIIQHDFAAAQKKMVQYDGNRQWFTFIKKEWPAIRDRWNTDKSNLSCAEIGKLYDRIEQAQDSFKLLLNTHIDHILWINAGKLKGELQPKINKIKEEVDVFLAQTARARTAKLQAYFKQRMHLLSERPTELKKFAEFVAHLNEVNAQQQTITAEIEEAENLYTLMEMQKVEIDDTDKQLRERTLGGMQQTTNQPMREQFTEAIFKAVDYKERKRDGMIKDLNDEINKVNEDCMGVYQVLNEDNYVQYVETAKPILDELVEVEQRLRTYQEKATQYSNYQQLFEMQPINFTALQSLTTLFEARKEAWSCLDEFNRKKESWWETPLKDIDVAVIESTVKELHQRSYKVNQKMVQENFSDEVTETLLQLVKEMKLRMPIILDLGNKNMTSEHWNRILYQVNGQHNSYNEETNSLQLLDGQNIWDFKDIIAEQSGTATGESNLNKALDDIRSIWDKVEFGTKQYKLDREVYILEKLDDVIQQLDDHHVQLQTIMASRFVVGVRSRAEEWATKLRVVSDVIEEWITMQKNWMYLEFIFSADDIKKQLVEESDRFDKVDKLFKSLTMKAHTAKIVLTICTEEGLLQQLRDNNKAIDEIQKRLEDYLETKRVAFPRFYFLSNDELLSILSDVRNPRAVQPHLTKCFDSIASLLFNNEEASEIGGMKSGEGEEVPFDRPIHPIGNVEMWLGTLEATMKSTLLMHMKETVDAYPKKVREEWYFSFPAQCVQAVDMVVWTGEVEEAITKGELQPYHEKYQQQIINTVGLVKKQLSKLQRTLVCTLIVVDVHNRDIIGQLKAAAVKDTTEFEWVQQLKYYWENDASMGSYSVGIHHCSAHLWYGYEYLGNQPRLVITPLTDRAFLTCTSALAMDLGAAPQGPAGTGKTESVKDLGKALARQVVVFNCSDGINYKTMSRMFAGLAQAGAWACFDEFNRIELEVLSVIAQQMLEITTALSQKLENMDFDGHPIKLSKNFGVFITMNPGYAGRTELPDNLKALFRPICMMIPDYALIAEIMFYSEGFSNARTLANKMVQLYKLSSEQLSKQDHYDFGMRAVKSILVMAGGLKRANPNESEDMLLIRAMRDSNVPKFLRDDTVLFMALVRDLFPTIEIREQENQQLVKYIKNDMTESKLQIVDGFVLKAVQLFDTLVVRHGVMTVGATFCAKTTIVETLQRTLTKMTTDECDPTGATPLINVVHTHILNPKSVAMGELYGEVNSITREWTDGLLSNIARNVKDDSQHNSHRHWIIFDGPVDSLWIENMNTVLDDSKMLCLFNGERIKLPSTASFMFEVQDLKVASPATVSRCGMVYVEPYYLDGGWKPIATTRITALTEKFSAQKFRGSRVSELFAKLVQPTLEFIRSSCKEYIPSADAQLVVSCIELLQSYVVANEKSSDVDEEDPAADTATDPLLAEFRKPPITAKTVPSDYNTLFDMYFIMSFIWSFGANIADSTRPAFNSFLYPLLSSTFSMMPKEAGVTIYDICLHKPSLSFLTWKFFVPDFAYRRNVPYFELFVATGETTSVKHVMQMLTSVSRNVLLSGVTGVGKSAVVQDFVSNTLGTDNPQAPWEFFATVFSAQDEKHRPSKPPRVEAEQDQDFAARTYSRQARGVLH